MSKVISQSLWFLLCFVIGLKFSPQLYQPIRSKTKAYHDLLARVFPRFGRRLHVFSLRSDWFSGLSASVVIGILKSNYFGFGLQTCLKINLIIDCKTVGFFSLAPSQRREPPKALEAWILARFEREPHTPYGRAFRLRPCAFV